MVASEDGTELVVEVDGNVGGSVQTRTWSERG